MLFSNSLAVLLLVISSVQGGLLPSLAVTQACDALNRKFPRNVAFSPLNVFHPQLANLNFTETVTHYWNAQNGQLVPYCVFYPTGASDVSYAVQILNRYPDVPWAAKSGGHNANQGWSSVDNGVLISFRPYMQGTTINPGGTVNIQPGARWSEAATALEPYSRAVVGGRLGDVGVGGYMLGGGLSFLTSQYGFACDQVVEFEVVLADGTITTANANQNTDLFFALKGGGNQFALVTNYKMNAIPIGKVWGGIKVYTEDKGPAIINATHDFAMRYPDAKAAIIPTFQSILGNTINVMNVFYFYNGPVVPAGVFSMFDSIQPLLDTTKVQTYADLLKANDITNLYGPNVLIRTQTLPLLADDPGRDILQYQLNSIKAYSRQTQAQNLDVLIYTFAIQPIPVLLQNASLATGSKNAFAFDLADGDRLWMQYDIIYFNPFDEQRAFSYARHITEDIAQYTRSKYGNLKSSRQTNDADRFSPLFLNDGMFDQATSLFYKADVYSKLKGIQRSRDPKRLFSKRTGGAKFT